MILLKWEDHLRLPGRATYYNRDFKSRRGRQKGQSQEAEIGM